MFSVKRCRCYGVLLIYGKVEFLIEGLVVEKIQHI